MKTSKISNDWYRTEITFKDAKLPFFGYSREESRAKATRFLSDNAADIYQESARKPVQEMPDQQFRAAMGASHG